MGKGAIKNNASRATKLFGLLDNGVTKAMAHFSRHRYQPMVNAHLDSWPVILNFVLQFVFSCWNISIILSCSMRLIY